MDRLDHDQGKDDDAVDFTNPTYDDYDEDNIQQMRNIRITNGINLKDLNCGSEVVFSPEIETKHTEEYKRNYFEGYSEHLEQMLADSKPLQDDLDEDGFLNDFDSFRKHSLRVTEDGGVMKRLLKAGVVSQGSVPDNGVVKIHYSMHLEGQDEPYDSSILRGKPEKYSIGAEGQLLPGMELGIKTMKKNEKAQFLINPNYAFGRFGCPPRIPANAQILATVELLDFVEDGKADAILSVEAEERGRKFSFDEILKAAKIEHKCGVSAVRNLEYRLAVKHNERGIKLLQDTSLANEEEQNKCNSLLNKLLLNAAFCYIKVNWPKKACLVCKDALQIEESAKALYRFGKAKRMLEDFEAARSLLIKAQRKRPNDPDIADELRSLEDQLIKDNAAEELLCKNMFGNIKSKRKEKIEQHIYDTFFEDFKEFSQEAAVGDNFSLSLADLTLQQVKAFKQAAEDLHLKVVADENKGTLTVAKVE